MIYIITDLNNQLKTLKTKDAQDYLISKPTPINLPEPPPINNIIPKPTPVIIPDAPQQTPIRKDQYIYIKIKCIMFHKL